MPTIPDRQELTRDLPSLGVVTVATNRYINYWYEMAQSAERHLFLGHEVVLHVFTDQIDEVVAMTQGFQRIVINPILIEPLVWPEATLLRYEVINNHRNLLTQDILMHLDADMLIVADVGSELQPELWRGGIALVRHPGFRRAPFRERASAYFKHPRMAISDAVTWIRLGALGSWETNPDSLAYVPRKDRKKYACGGTWLGLQQPFLAMTGDLASRTRIDLDQERIAVWHDESHLNWFASTHQTAFLDSEYCFAPGFSNLKDLTPRIIAVDKGYERTR